MEIVFVVSALCSVVCGAIVELILFCPILGTLLLKKWQKMHQRVTSDIPGNPHAFDDSIVSLFCTLPEPSNFNIVWTGLPLEEDLMLVGTLPSARCNSFSLYGSGSTAAPSSIDAKECTVKDDDRRVALQITRDETCQEAHLMVKNEWRSGFLAMRNYLVPPGTKVITPKIIRTRDGTVVRESQALYAGPGAVSGDAHHLWQGILLFNTAYFALLVTVLQFTIPESLFVLIGCGYVAYFIRRSLFRMGKKRLGDFCTKFTPEKNVFVYADHTAGSSISQPSLLHHYWIMKYDVPSLHAAVMNVTIRPSWQKYWSFVVYDEFGLPLSQYVYDGNYSHDSTKEYDVRVELCNSANAASTGANAIDVSSSPKGYVLFRLVHVTDDRAVELTRPHVSEIVPCSDSALNHKQKLQ